MDYAFLKEIKWFKKVDKIHMHLKKYSRIYCYAMALLSYFFQLSVASHNRNTHFSERLTCK